MTELPAVLAVGEDTAAGVFYLSGNTLAVLFYALNLLNQPRNWRSYPGEEIEPDELDDIDDVVSQAAYEVMHEVMKPGMIQMWTGDTTPERWLLCDGAEVSRADYAELFDEIGETFGAGNGTTTFNLPDMRYRSPMGASVSPNLNLGEQAGEAAHALSQIENASHTHDIIDNGHAHAPAAGTTVFVGRTAGGSSDWVRATAGATFRQDTATASAITGISMESSGNGVPHNNVHPVLGLNFIIYTGV